MNGRVCAVVAAGLVGAAALLSACGSSPTSTPSTSSTATTTPYRWGVVGNKGAITQLELSTPTAVGGISGTIVQIATSNSDGYALTSTGHVWGWGVNSYGELGDGKTTPYDTSAVEVELPRRGQDHVPGQPDAVRRRYRDRLDRHAWGWGLNGDNDLCLSGLEITRPEQLPLSDVTLATGARTHALFSSHGTVYACGAGDAGELGNGSTNPTATPSAVVGLPAGEKVTALTSSWEGSGSLLADGSYYNWGYNAQGQLGDGTTTDSAVPVKVNLAEGVTRVFQGGSGKKNGQTIASCPTAPCGPGAPTRWANSASARGCNRPRRSRSTCRLASRSSRSTRVATPATPSIVPAVSGPGARTTRGNWVPAGTSRSKRSRSTLGSHFTQVSSTAQNVAGFR